MTATGCLDEAAVLSFLDGLLTHSERAVVEVHLEECATCNDLVTFTGAALASGRATKEPGRPRGPALIGHLPMGTMVGRYEILGPIGQGAMAEVYAAYHPDLDRQIALKVVGELGTHRDERRARLLREARAIARLSHPNVVTVYDAGSVDNAVYIAMELIVGQTVHSWLSAAHRGWPEILPVFISAGRGLAAAHRAGVVHRDFKPPNIMIGADGVVRVTDFGLARLVPENLDPATTTTSAGPLQGRSPGTVTATNELVGTPAYMAPEQFRGVPADAGTDQFSFFVALHEAINGARPRMPHLADTRETQSFRVASNQTHRRPHPSWLARIISRGLSTDPAQRFSSMDDAIRALDRGRRRVRRVSFALGGVIAISLGTAAGWRVTHPVHFECRPAPTRFSAVWPLSADLQKHVLSSGRGDAPALWRNLSTSLEEYVNSWKTSYRDACEATRVRGEQSEQVLDLRMQCLGDNLDEVHGLVTILGTADRRSLGQGVVAVRNVSPVAHCSDIRWLQSTVPLPHDERTRLIVRDLEKALSRIKALRALGFAQTGLAEAETLRARVESTSYQPLLAKVLQVTAVMQSDIGNIEASEALLKDAFVAAEAGREDLTKAEAASCLIYATGFQGRYFESTMWAKVATAILDRLGPGHERTRSWVLEGQAVVAMRRGDFELARSLSQQSVELKERALGREHPDVMIGLLALGLALKELGQLSEALEVEDRAYRISNKGGVGTLLSARAQVDRGEVLIMLKRFSEAKLALGDALVSLEAEVGADNVLVAHPLAGLAEIALATDRPGEAVTLFSRALSIRERKETDRLLVAETRFGMARALFTRGRNRTRAIAMAEAALAFYNEQHHTPGIRAVDRWFDEQQLRIPAHARHL